MKYLAGGNGGLKVSTTNRPMSPVKSPKQCWFVNKNINNTLFRSGKMALFPK